MLFIRMVCARASFIIIRRNNIDHFSSNFTVRLCIATKKYIFQAFIIYHSNSFSFFHALKFFMTVSNCPGLRELSVRFFF